jgi:hypothetical protein
MGKVKIRNQLPVSVRLGVRRKDLLARFANPEIDFDLDGYPIDSNFVVIVRVADCEVTERHPCGSPKRVKTDNAQSYVQLEYSATYCGYTEWKEVKSKRWITYADENTGDLESTNVFFRRIKYSVEDGKVYSKSILMFNRIPAGFLRKKIKDNTRNVLIEKNNTGNQ